MLKRLKWLTRKYFLMLGKQYHHNTKRGPGRPLLITKVITYWRERRGVGGRQIWTRQLWRYCPRPQLITPLLDGGYGASNDGNVLLIRVFSEQSALITGIFPSFVVFLFQDCCKVSFFDSTRRTVISHLSRNLLGRLGLQPLLHHQVLRQGLQCV